MLRTIIVGLLFCSNLAIAQTDSLGVFRNSTSPTGSKNKWGKKISKNSITLSLSHISRGGILVAYERQVGNSPFSLYTGLGFSTIDFVGQFSFENESYYFNAENYTKKVSYEFLRTFELGTKFLIDEDLGGPYVSLCYSNFKNAIKVAALPDYSIAPGSLRTHTLNYSSNEIKFCYGSMNDMSSSFYSDFNLGFGLRFIDYQELDISNRQYNQLVNMYVTPTEELEIKKLSKSDILLWFFLGLKIGFRF